MSIIVQHSLLLDRSTSVYATSSGYKPSYHLMLDFDLMPTSGLAVSMTLASRAVMFSSPSPSQTRTAGS